jgi:hypothetical protein
MRTFDAFLRWAVTLLLFVSLPAMCALNPQIVPAHPPFEPGTPSEGDPGDIMAKRQAMEQAKKRNSTRQQQLVNDAAKLVALSQELKDEVDKSTKDTLSLTVIKKAEEIEKLAKEVKLRMREGQ